MKRWLPLSCLLAAVVQTGHAAEVTLEISPPEPSWFLPPEIAPGPCAFGGYRIEACPKQLMPEGIANVGEQSLVIDIEPPLALGDYAAVLARIAQNYGPELALLEAGDIDGFRRTRTPTAGGGTLRPVPGAQGRVTPSMGLYTDRSIVPLAGGLGSPPGRDPSDLRIGPPRDTISATILYVIGHSYFSLQRYLPAETAFTLVLDALPNHVRAHESLGMLYLVTERYDDARVHFKKLAELGRNAAPVHAARGYLEQKAHHYYDAADAFQKALILEPGSRSAKRGLLHALTETREHGKAKALVEALLADEPDDPDLWLYRAQVALMVNDPEVALASLEAALRLGDDSEPNRRTCAALHVEHGSIARAAELLSGSAARGLDLELVHRVLDWLANANEWERFRALLTSVDRDTLRAVDSSRLATHRARLALHDGNRRAASAALEEALALDPANADALVAQGHLHREQRDYGRADFLFRRASAYRAVREAASVARAGVAVDQANFDDALTVLRDAVMLNPTSSALRRNVDVLEDIVLLRTER